MESWFNLIAGALLYFEKLVPSVKELNFLFLIVSNENGYVRKDIGFYYIPCKKGIIIFIHQDLSTLKK